MKAAFFTAAAALAGSVMANELRRGHAHGHAALHHRGLETPATCGCTTSVVTYWGSPTVIPFSAAPTTTSTTTTTLKSTSYATVTVQASSSIPASSAPASTYTPPLPTSSITVFPTPGTYTLPATTITVTSDTYVCGATSATVPSGTHTVGGVTTIVEHSTTVTCPYATVKPSGSTVTSVIETTTYWCPSAGTYTIAPTTTYVPTSTVLVWPTPAAITSGTYTAPEQTVTVTEHSFTYTCPAATGLSSSTVAPAPAPAQPTTTAVAAPAPTSVASSVASSAPAPSSTITSGSTGGSSLGQVENYAITYTGYSGDTGACLTSGEVKVQLATIKAAGFHAIRMYSTDCNQLETVATQAVEMGLNVILGVFISNAGVSSGNEQVSDIVNWGKSSGWKGVEFIVLDNEALLDGYTTASELAGFVSSASQTIKSAGYTGQFTISEPLNVWQESGATLCGAVDFVSANVQAFFNGGITAANAGSFVAQEVDLLKKICSGKGDVVFVGESGWPHAGDTNGAAIPGVIEQSQAMDSIRKECGTYTAQFSFSSDKWKSPGTLGVEQFWGLTSFLESLL